MYKRILLLSIGILLTAVTFFMAAIQIPHIGEGAPDWHTVKRPQIPVESVGSDSCPPPLPESADPAHPPIAISIKTRICVSEPIWGWRFDPAQNKWVYSCLGKHAVVKYISSIQTAYWLETLQCYGFYDQHGRLRLLPDYR